MSQSAAMLKSTKTVMNTNDKLEPRTFLTRRIGMMMGLLALQFLIGMALNLVGEPEDTTPGLTANFWHVLLAAHIIIGLVLLGSAIYLLAYSVKSYRKLQKPLTISLAGISLSIIFGLLTIGHVHAELASFLMALTFLIAISTYGRTLEGSH